jgi:hypothetical protein
MSTKIAGFTVAGILWVALSLGLTQDLEINRATLRGLENIYVAVERLDPDARAQGLNEDQIHTEAVECLKKAGLAIQTKGEFDVSPEKVFLYIRLSSLRRGSCIAYALTVAVRQEVMLVRDPGVTLVAETWSAGVVGSADPGKFKGIAMEAVKGYLDRFLSARQSVASK